MDEIANTLLNMTWRNPIFIGIFIMAIWFIPGILIRRFAEKKYNEKMKDNQAKKIARLYPEEKKD